VTHSAALPASRPVTLENVRGSPALYRHFPPGGQLDRADRLGDGVNWKSSTGKLLPFKESGLPLAPRLSPNPLRRRLIPSPTRITEGIRTNFRYEPKSVAAHPLGMAPPRAAG